MTTTGHPLQEERPAVPAWRRVLPLGTTALILYLVFQRIPLARFVEALRGADYGLFFLLMLPHSVLFFAWDTLVLSVAIRWFHGPLRYRELLPVRAVSYVVSLMNTHLARASMAWYLKRQLRAPFLQLAGTVLFLTLVEMAHLGAWSTAGMLAFRARMPERLFWVPAGFVVFWSLFLLYMRGNLRGLERLPSRARVREWLVCRTFVQAPLKRYGQLILLRAPMFFVSLVVHWLAVRAFGIEIPFLQMMAFLPVIFMLAALPVTVAHLGTTQAAWIFFFSDYAPAPQLLAYSLCSHLAFMLGRGLLGLLFLPRAYRDLLAPLKKAGVAPPVQAQIAES